MDEFSIETIVKDMEREEKKIKFLFQVLTWFCFIVILISFTHKYEQKILSKDQQIQMYKARWETRDKAATYYKQQLELERAKHGSTQK